MGLIGLHLGIITPETEIYNSGAYIRGRAYKDLAEPGDYDPALDRAPECKPGNTSRQLSDE